MLRDLDIINENNYVNVRFDECAHTYRSVYIRGNRTLKVILLNLVSFQGQLGNGTNFLMKLSF